MNKLFKYIFLLLTTIIIFTCNNGYAKVKNYDEAWEYVTNKDNGYCAYKTDKIVLGIKSKGINKGFDTYVFHKDSGLITEKKVFSSQGFEKGKCPRYAQVQLGYIDGNAIYGIMLSNYTTTLEPDTDSGWTKATQGYSYDSKIMEIQFDSSQKDGKPNINPSPEATNSYETKKEEYSEKYNCIYTDDANRIIFGNNGDTSKGSLYMGYEISTYEIKVIGDLTSNKCANYAKIIRGTYEDKEVYKVFLSEDQKKLDKLSNKDMGIKKLIVSSNVLANLNSYNVKPPEINTDLPEDLTKCNYLLGYPDDPGSPAYYLLKAFHVIKYVALVLLVVLSVMDFTGAIAKQDKDAMAKVLKKLMMRFILCIIIFLLPYLIQLLLNYLVERQTDLCGIK